jgi:hypothetical protein
VDFDKYETKSAPVIISSGKEAKVKTNVTKRSVKGN